MHRKPVIGFINDERGTAGVAFLAEGGELLCGCGALVRIAINRNGQSQCVECDAREARIVVDPGVTAASIGTPRS